MYPTLTFRIEGTIPNLKNEHVPAERRLQDGRKVPFIRRTKTLQEWMNAMQTEFKRQLTQQVADVTVYPLRKTPFKLRVVFWTSRPYAGQDRDGQLATLLDTMQRVVFHNDSYYLGGQLNVGRAARGSEYADIVVAFQEGLDDIDTLRTIVPECYRQREGAESTISLIKEMLDSGEETHDTGIEEHENVRQA